MHFVCVGKKLEGAGLMMMDGWWGNISCMNEGVNHDNMSEICANIAILTYISIISMYSYISSNI